MTENTNKTARQIVLEACSYDEVDKSSYISVNTAIEAAEAYAAQLRPIPQSQMYFNCPLCEMRHNSEQLGKGNTCPVCDEACDMCFSDTSPAQSFKAIDEMECVNQSQTVEEAAYSYVLTTEFALVDSIGHGIEDSFIKGAQWQSTRMYTEQQVIELMEKMKIESAKECDKSSHPALAILQIDVKKIFKKEVNK